MPMFFVILIWYTPNELGWKKEAPPAASARLKMNMDEICWGRFWDDS